ncbi:MAG: LacI family DNA-binding transcriptional regulator [Devosia sp.]
MTKRVTLKDIARVTGYHVSTVSRALDQNSRINLTEDVVQQIRKTADTMGYRRNQIASGLRTKRTMSIGVVIPDITNVLFPPIVRGIESVLEPEGYASIIVNTDNLLERENRLVDILTERGVDGILHAAPLRSDRSIARLVDQDVPVVTLNRRIEGLDVPFVVNDERSGISLMMQHLFDHGHRRIAHVAGPAALSTGSVRLDAFLAMRDTLGLTEEACPVALSTRFDEDEGHRCMGELLDTGAGFTAVLCANDRLALGAVGRLREAGLAVPHDVSVTGFNDSPTLELIQPRLTTIRIKQFQTGQEAARILLSLLGRSPKVPETHVVLPVVLVERDSVAPPRQA